MKKLSFRQKLNREIRSLYDTNKEFEGVVGIDHNTLNRRKKDPGTITIYEARRMAEALSMTVSEFAAMCCE